VKMIWIYRNINPEVLYNTHDNNPQTVRYNNMNRLSGNTIILP